MDWDYLIELFYRDVDCVGNWVGFLEELFDAVFHHIVGPPIVCFDNWIQFGQLIVDVF